MGSIWFYWVLLGFTGFYWVVTVFFWVFLSLTGVLWFSSSVTGFQWVLLGFTGFQSIETMWFFSGCCCSVSHWCFDGGVVFRMPWPILGVEYLFEYLFEYLDRAFSLAAAVWKRSVFYCRYRVLSILLFLRLFGFCYRELPSFMFGPCSISFN